jgi:hypothetical protein
MGLYAGDDNTVTVTVTSDTAIKYLTIYGTDIANNKTIFSNVDLGGTVTSYETTVVISPDVNMAFSSYKITASVTHYINKQYITEVSYWGLNIVVSPSDITLYSKVTYGTNTEITDSTIPLNNLIKLSTAAVFTGKTASYVHLYGYIETTNSTTSFDLGEKTNIADTWQGSPCSKYFTESGIITLYADITIGTVTYKRSTTYTIGEGLESEEDSEN